jgi:hypothetical protein
MPPSASPNSRFTARLDSAQNIFRLRPLTKHRFSSQAPDDLRPGDPPTSSKFEAGASVKARNEISEET